MKIEFQFFDGCPNHIAVRSLLDDVLSERGVAVQVDVTDVGDDPAAAERARFGGSPTIRIDGVDIEPGFGDDGDYTLRCRVFQTADGLRGMPERSWIESAVDRAVEAGVSA